MTPAHEKLLGDMERYVTEIGGISYSACYADRLTGDAKRILANRHTVQATYIRTRSDRLCFFSDRSVLFEYDAKTNERGEDFFVECIPVMHHLIAYHYFGIKTVYGFRWPTLAVDDIGVVLDSEFRNQVDGVFVYGREDLASVTAFVMQHYKAWFPKADLFRVSRRIGSGDPSIRIRRDVVRDNPHWKSVIDSLTAYP